VGSDAPQPEQQTVVGLRLFGRTILLRAGAALAVLFFVLAAIGALIAFWAWRSPASFRSAMHSPLWISAALWIAMIVYWSAAAKKIGRIQSAESTASRARHQLLLRLALLFAFVRFPWTGGRWLPSAWWVVPAGLMVQLAFMLLDVWAMRCLGRNWSGAVAIKVDHALIRSGPYRRIRHPIYTAMIGMYLGTAIVSGELHGLMGVGLAALAYARKIRMEERGLIDVFGQEYRDYKRASWALVPWVF